MKKQILSFSLVVVGFLLGATALSALAQTWSPPGTGYPASTNCTPPNCNVSAPINVGSSLQEKLGSLLLDGNLGIIGNLVVATGSPQVGDVLAAQDINGTVGWRRNGSLTTQNCGSSQFVKGIDSSGNIICDYVVPMATVAVNTDEQVVIHLKGTSVTLTNQTGNGASLSSDSFADMTNGMPTDGKLLKIYNLVSNNGNAKILSSCPTGYTPTSNPSYILSDEMCIYQQPASSNGYETIVAIWDGAAGAHSWSFNLGYQ
jgi:hypothetical protein